MGVVSPCTLELPGGFGGQLVVDKLIHRENGVTGQALEKERVKEEGIEKEEG